MRRGFTLLELIVVIIIVGILATLGFTQYGRMVERSRGAEPRAILGSIRTFAVAHRLEHGNLVGFGAAQANIGAGADQMPPAGACRTSHYFGYGVAVAGDVLTATATRCTAGGKTPNAAVANTLTLTSDLGLGTDAWASPIGGY